MGSSDEEDDVVDTGGDSSIPNTSEVGPPDAIKIRRGRYYFINKFFFGAPMFYKTTTDEIVLAIDSDPGLRSTEIGVEDVAELILQKEFRFTFSRWDHNKADRSFILRELVGISKSLYYLSIVPDELIIKVAISTLLIILLTFDNKDLEKNVEYVLLVINREHQSLHCYEECKRAVLQNRDIEYRAKSFCKAHFSNEFLQLHSALENLTTRDIIELDLNQVRDKPLEEWIRIVNFTSSSNCLDRETSSQDVLNLKECVEKLCSASQGGNYRDLSNSDQYKVRKKFRKILEEFFSNLRVSKIMKEGGIVFSMNNIPSLLSYAINLSSISSEISSDNSTLQFCIDTIHSLIDNGEALPLNAIKRQVFYKWESLRKEFTDIDVKILDDIMMKFQQAITYEESWNYALMIKGTLYEMLFAKEYKLPYVKEHMKQSISEIIKTHFSDKFQEFQDRSGKHVAIRDYKPDFYLTTSLAKEVLMPDRPPGTKFPSSNLEGYSAMFPVRPKEVRRSESGSKLRISLSHRDVVSHDVLEAKLEQLKTGISGHGGQQIKHNIPLSITEALHYLILIEVGYQTDAKTKVEIDMNKYKPLLSILKESNIEVIIISVADSSQNLEQSSWLSPASAKIVKKWISSIFSKLSAGMPVGVTDIAIGDISTKKLRSKLASGHTRRSPITLNDVLEYYSENKEDFLRRPDGTLMPKIIQQQFVSNLVFGSVMDKRSSDSIIEALYKNGDEIVKCVKKSDLVWEITDSSSCYLYVFGMFTGFIKSYVNSPCTRQQKDSSEVLDDLHIIMTTDFIQSSDRLSACRSLERKLIMFIKDTSSHNNLKNCICRKDLCEPLSSWGSSLLRDIQLVDPPDYYSHNRAKLSSTLSPLDRLCHITISSRTGKQKEAKNHVIAILEYIGSFLPGFLRDGKGSLIGTYGFLLRRLGLIVDQKKSDSQSAQLEKSMENVIRPKRDSRQIEVADSRKQNNLKEFLSKLLLKLDKAISKSHSLTNECLDLLKEIKTIVQDSLETPLGSVIEFINCNLKPSSYIVSPQLNECLKDLLRGSIQADTFQSFLDSIAAKQVKFSKVEDKRFPIFDSVLIKEHLDLLSSLSHWNDIGPSYTIIKKEILNELYDRVGEGSINSRMIKCIEKFCHIMLKSELFKVLYIYSKICESYINFTSEMSSPGIKIGRIKDLNLNLIVKVSKRKETNSSVLLTTLKFEKYTDRFFMDRAKATLGQTLIYCELVTLFQALQTKGLFTTLESCNADDIIKDLMASQHYRCKVLTGVMRDTLNEGFSYEIMKSYIQHLTDSETGNLIEIIGNFTTIAAMILVPAYMNNSRKISKLLQMYRYQLVISLSDFCFPLGAGKKSVIALRRIDSQVIFLFIAICSFHNIRMSEHNISTISAGVPEDMPHIVSLQLWPLACGGSRQALSDIYVCHIFNKEMSDFDEGSIRVLNEFVDRVFAWEEDVSSTCKKYARLCRKYDNNSKHGAKQCLSRLRCLLGLKKTRAIGIDDEFLVEAMRKKRKIEKLNRGKGKFSDSSSSTDNSEKNQQDEVDSFKTKESRLYDTHFPMLPTTPQFTPNIELRRSKSEVEGTKSVSSSHSLWSYSDRDLISDRLFEEDDISGSRIDEIISQVRHICTSMKTYTFGCAEVCQAFCERSKFLYTSPNISRALKSHRNHEQISQISETTSILSEGLYEFNIEASLQTVIKKDAVKIGKTLNRQNRIQSDTSSKFRNFEKEISKLLLFPKEQQDKEKKVFDDMVMELKKRGSIGWKDIMILGLNSVFRTDSCGYMFSFIKSFWKFTKGKLKGKYSNLRDKCNEMFNFSFGKETQDIRVVSDTRLQVERFRSDILEHIFSEYIRICFQGSSEIAKERLIKLEKEFFEITILQKELDELSETKPDVSFPERESELREGERAIFRDYSSEISLLCFAYIACEITCPFSLSSKSHSRMSFNDYKHWLFANSIQKKFGESSKESEKSSYYSIVSIGETLCTAGWLSTFLEKGYGLLGGTPTANLLAFIALIIINIKNPISSRMIDLDNKDSKEMDLKKQIDALYSRSKPEVINFDVGMIVALTVKGSIQLGRRLLNRQEQGIRLPRSPRSKVIFEMIKLVRLQNTTSVQQMGFQIMKDKTHHFYASLAPKAQIGGDRDLLVMERGTKVAIHCTETASKSLMDASVRNDGLTNKNLKEDILSKGQCAIRNKKIIDEGIKIDSTEVEWCVVECISGDCTKWGPIHCPAFFSSVVQQLLKDHPDWSAAYMLVMLKSLNKRLEIPASSIEKIIRSVSGSEHFKKLIGSLKFEGDEEKKRHAMLLTCEKLWTNNPTVQGLVRDFLTKGERAFKSYNHMGQGIHHGTSSLHGNVCSNPIDELVGNFIQRKMTGIHVTIEHAGSSDDFAKIITLRGTIPVTLAKSYQASYKRIICEALNYMSGLMRSCQMMISEKSVVSPILAEFYSEFSIGDTVQPSTAKFINSQMINFSVTSPLTLYQSCRVDAQQAMYMGISLGTITAMCIFKQNIFVSHSEEFYHKYSKLILNGLPSNGRFYLPTYSNLLDVNGTLEEINLIKHSLISLLTDSDWELNDEVVKTHKGAMSGAFTVSLSTQIQSNTNNESDYSEMSNSEESTGDDDSRMAFSSPEMKTLDNDTSPIRSILNLLMCKYYSSNSSLTISQGFTRLADSKCTSIIDDPFLQLQPESVRSKIKQVKELKEDMYMNRQKNDSSPTFALKDAAREILSKSVGTENFDIENSRLKQALDSRLIVWGLSGGIRNVSLPLHRQMLRSYLFSNNLPITFRNTWLRGDESKYIKDDGTESDPVMRVKYSEFLNKVANCKLYTDEEMTYLEKDELTQLCEVPIQCEEDESGHIIVRYSAKGLKEFLSFLNQLTDELVDERILSMQTYESTADFDLTPIPPPKIFKSRIMNISGRQSLRNDPAVIASFMLCQDSIYETLPKGVDYAMLSTDVHNFRSTYPSITHMIDRAREVFESGLKHETDFKLLIRAMLGALRLISKSSHSYIHLYVMCSGNFSDFAIDHNTLFRYCTIERHEIQIESVSHIKIHDTTVYDIMGCVNIINWSCVDENTKTSLLLRLLRCNLKLLSTQCEATDVNCLHIQSQKSKISYLEGGTCSSLLYKESQRLRSKDKSKSYKILSQLSNNAGSLAGLDLDYEVSTEIDYRGTATNAMFTFSSNVGTACGCIINSMAYITIFPCNAGTLESLELPLLKEMKYTGTTVDQYKMRQHFFRLLPLFSDISQKIEGRYVLLDLSHDGNFMLLPEKPIHSRSSTKARVVWLSTSALVSFYKYKRLERFDPILKWTPTALYIYLEREVWSGAASKNLDVLLSAARNTLGKKQLDLLTTSIAGSYKRVLLCRINTTRQVSWGSLNIFHIITSHKHLLTDTRLQNLSDTDIETMNESVGSLIKESDDDPGFLFSRPPIPEEGDLNDRLRALLKHRSTIGLDSIYPLFTLFKTFSLSDLKLTYEGVSERRIGSVGSWSVSEMDESVTQYQLSLADDITKLKQMMKITRNTFPLAIGCVSDSTVVEVVDKISSFFNKTQSTHLSYLCLVLSLSHMTYHNRELISVRNPFASLVNRLLSTRTVYNFLFNQNVSVSLDMKSDICKLLLSFHCSPSVNTEEKQQQLIKLLKTYTPFVENWISARRGTNWDQDNNRATIHYSLDYLISRENFLSEMDSILNKCLNTNYRKTCLRSAYCLSIRMLSVNFPVHYITNQVYRSWLDESLLHPDDKFGDFRQEQLTMEAFLEDFERHLISQPHVSQQTADNSDAIDILNRRDAMENLD